MRARKEGNLSANSGNPHQTIAFIDLTGGKKFDLNAISQRPLSEVLNQIKLDTGRDIVIKEKSSLDCLGIAKYDAPIGYSLFANKDIKKNQILFNYGGIEKRRKGLNNPYLLQINEQLCLDAQKEGDLGSLLNHLFDSVQLQGYTKVEIDEAQYETIQFHNLGHVAIKTDYGIDHQFHALEAIPCGAVLGFSYGYSYWMSQGISPLLMSKQGNPITNLSVKEPLFCLRSCASQSEMGSILYRKNDLLFHLSQHQNKKLCVFWPSEPHRPVAYANKYIMESLIEKTSHSAVFVFISVKEIGSELARALAAGANRIELPLSIYAQPGQAGPFADRFVQGEERFETHEIDSDYTP